MKTLLSVTLSLLSLFVGFLSCKDEAPPLLEDIIINNPVTPDTITNDSIILDTIPNESIIPDTIINNPPDTNSLHYILQNTNWKLAGIVDIRTNNIKALEPTDCDRCYTFSIASYAFGSDHNPGYSTINYLSVNLERTPFMQIMTSAGAGGDGLLFEEVSKLLDSVSYESENNNLKFFYTKNNRSYYLLYKFIE